MKRKPLFPMPLVELEKLPTKRLLGRLHRLRQCEESLALSDKDAADESGCIEFKQSPEWILAYREVKQMLSHREHVPRKSERIRSGAKAARMVKKQRTKKPIMQKPAETTAPQPQAFYELLSHIEQRPGMYVGSDDHLSGLQSYLTGYDAACATHGHPQLLMGLTFARWVFASKRLRVGGPANGAFVLARQNSPDSRAAWKTLFQWFREYHTLTSGHQFESLEGAPAGSS